MLHRPLSTPLLALAALLSFPAAQDREGGATAPASVPTVVLESAAGEERRVPLAGFETEDPRDGGGVLVRFEGLGREPEPLPPEQLAEVVLARGGLARGTLIGGDGELLDLRVLGEGRLRLSIEAIASLRVHDRVPADWTGPLTAPAEGDRLYRTRSGGLDRIDGTVESFESVGVRLETSLGVKLFPWNEVAALCVEVFDEDLDRPDRGVPVVIDLLDGSRLPASLTRISEEGGVELLTSADHALRVPVAAVSELLVQGGGLAFLSDLEPTRAEPTEPFGDGLGMSWQPRFDRSCTGGPLRAGGRVWTRGIGVHAVSEITYTLDGGWTHLRGYVAVDAEVEDLPGKGSVTFEIHGDGRVLWDSRETRGGVVTVADGPVAIPPIELKGVRQLVLKVGDGGDTHVADRADWLRLILSR